MSSLLSLLRVVNDSEATVAEKYQKFMNTNYSSATILVLILGYLTLNECVFRDLGIFPFTAVQASPPLFWSSFCKVVRLAMAGSLCFIWRYKTENSSALLIDEHLGTYLSLAQALFPVLMNTIFAVLIFSELISGCYIGSGDLFQFSPIYFAQFGLQVYPLLVFFLLRDTQPAAVLFSWVIAVVTMFACCCYSHSIGAFISVTLYTVVSATLFYEHHRQNKAMFAVVTKLEETLEENERLAVEAQATELRAMIGNVAHDLKTPLTSFLSGTEYMEDIVKGWEDDLRADRKEHFMREAPQKLQTLRTCLLNMSSTNSFMSMTINRCLDFTKASSGFKLVPKLETVELMAMLKKPVQLIHDTQNHGIRKIRIAPLAQEICTHVITDQQWLLENLLCLLSNAAKYSQKGCVDVTVELVPNARLQEKKNSDDGASPDEDCLTPQCLRFEVQDTGVGLSEEAMLGLFNPFKQAQRLAGGTGLGLFSLAKRVEALKGQYGVARRPDGAQGCMFWFTIPYRPDTVSASLAERVDTNAAAATASPTACTKPGEEPDVGLGLRSYSSDVPEWDHYRVMIVDDAPLVVKMVRLLLTHKGHQVVNKAANGEEALEKLVHGYTTTEPQGEPPFDVVLMDLQMPVLDGIEAIRRLRAFERSFRQDCQKQEVERRDDHEYKPGPHFQEPHTQPLACPDTARTSLTSKPFHQFVVAFSANSDHETKQAAMEAGADAFVTKPFSYESFRTIMHNA